MSENDKRTYPSDIAGAALRRLRLDHDPLTREDVMLHTPKTMKEKGAKKWQLVKFRRQARAITGETISSRKK